MFYRHTLPSANLPLPDMKTNVVQYVFSALMNGMSTHKRLPFDTARQWLTSLPKHVLRKTFKMFPKQLRQIVLEKLFILALGAGKIKVVQSMLDLGADPYEKLNFPGNLSKEPVSPLSAVFRLNLRHENVLAMVKTLLSHMCRKPVPQYDPDDLLIELLQPNTFRSQGYNNTFSDAEHIELMRIPISCGAKLTKGCLMVLKGDAEAMTQMADIRQDGAQGWLRDSLLNDCLRVDSRHYLNGLGPQHRSWALAYFLQDRLFDLGSAVPETSIALPNAFHIDREWRDILAADAIFAAIVALGLELDCSRYGKVNHADINIRRLSGGAHAAFENLEAQVPANHNDEQLDVKTSKEYTNTEDQTERLYKMCAAKDHQGVENLLKPVRFTQESLYLSLVHAAVLGWDDIALTVLDLIDTTAYLKVSSGCRSLLKLMEHGRCYVISTLICKNQCWNAALDPPLSSTSYHQYDELENLLYRIKPTHGEGPLFPGGLKLSTSSNQQIA